MRKTLTVGTLLLALPLVTAAQHRAGTPSMGMAPAIRLGGMAVTAPAMHSAPVRPTGYLHMATGSPMVPGRPVISRNTFRSAGPVVTPRYHTVYSGGRSGNASMVRRRTPSPGLGIDHGHHGKGLQHRNHFPLYSGFILPFVGGGMYIPDLDYVDFDASAESADQDIPSEPQEPATETADRETAPEAPVSTRSSATTVPEQVSEFIFVRRDGSLFFAVAYSWTNDKLQYVSQDGLRRIVPLDSLDLGATQQFNDQRGVTIRLPA